MIMRKRWWLGVSVSAVASTYADVYLALGADSTRPQLRQPPAFTSAVGVGKPAPNSCLDMDMSVFARGFSCGSPMSKPCFDFERCGQTPSIYVYDSGCSLVESSTLLARDEAEEPEGTRMNHHYLEWIMRTEIQEAGLLAESYDSACLFVHVGEGRRLSCAVDAPLWEEGMAHVMIDMSDEGRNYRPRIADSYAMEAASNMHSCFYRTGYDVSISLAPEHVFQSLAGIAPWDRRFFLTTKGTVYLSGHGSEDRMSLVPLHDEDQGVIMSLHCHDTHGEDLLPENADYCESLRDRYNDYDFGSLMNTTFGLVPAGRSPGTYRLGEVMSAGAIPVFVGRDMVAPFREQFDWPSFSFWFAPDQVGPEMMATLRAVPQAVLEDMQRKSLEAYRRMFGTDVNDFRPSAKLLVDILRRRLEHRGSR